MRVTSAKFIQAYEALAGKALVEPVIITEKGHDCLVLVSANEYARLKRRDRRAVFPEELTEQDIAAIAASEMDSRHDHLNGLGS